MLVYEKINDHLLYLSGEHSHKEKAAMFLRALITREIMRRKDAQCNTKESPSVKSSNLDPRALLLSSEGLGSRMSNLH